jgi:thymidine kinase
MGKSIPIPRCGEIEIVQGLMGSGKTLYSIWMITNIVRFEMRPVFTNCPFKWRVFRQYLKVKFGEEAARLVFPLTEDHLRRFIERQHKAKSIRERIRLEHDANGERVFESHIAAAIADEIGEPITRGPDANWVLPGSYVVVDEAQHWFPMQHQSSQSKVLQDYLTMIRHHFHQVVMITQDASRLDIAARKLASHYHCARKCDDDKLFGPIRLRHVGIKAVMYEKFTKEQMEATAPGQKAGAGKEPLESKLMLLNAPWLRYRFRLYSSFTHMGSPRMMRTALDRTREELGVMDAVRRNRDAAAFARKERPFMLSRMFRAAVWFAFLVVFFGGFGFILGVSRAPAMHEADAEQQPGETVPLLDPALFASGSQLVAVTRSGVIIDRSFVREGQQWEGATIEYVDRDRGMCLVSHLDGVFWWDVGSSPRFVGTARVVLEQLRQARGDAERPAVAAGLGSG